MTPGIGDTHARPCIDAVSSYERQAALWLLPGVFGPQSSLMKTLVSQTHDTVPGEPYQGLVPMLVERGYRPVDRLRPRHAREIRASPWGVGCETCDRGYIDFDQVGPHLGALGAKSVRLQAGWAKCEPVPGEPYHWGWLDGIIDSAVEQGVRPWLQTSYGNPAYEGGGGISLAQGPPRSEAALKAWDAWIAALAARYRDRVDEWEVWNEPDHNQNMSVEEYIDLYIRTAEAIRAADPGARIAALSLCTKLDYAEAFLHGLHQRRRSDLLDELSFHFYPHNPDGAFHKVDAMIGYLGQYAPHATLRQGETGAPAETIRFLALGEFDWSPRKQAVWCLRRLLAHHAHGVPMSLFQLSDMRYEARDGADRTGHNTKGLIETRPDCSAARRRPSYFMAQHVFGQLDDAYPLRRLEHLAPDTDPAISAYAWMRRDRDSPSLVAWWRADEPPALDDGPSASLSLPAVPMRHPVLVDFMSGHVFAVPADRDPWADLPLSDSALALAERDALHLRS